MVSTTPTSWPVSVPKSLSTAAQALCSHTRIHPSYPHEANEVSEIHATPDTTELRCAPKEGRRGGGQEGRGGREERKEGREGETDEERRLKDVHNIYYIIL